MARYKVYLNTIASVSVTVEVPDGIDADMAVQQALDAAFDQAPTLCVRCSGWGNNYSMDLGEWELDRDHNGKEVMPEKVDG